MSYKEVGNGIVYSHSTLLTTLKLIYIKKEWTMECLQSQYSLDHLNNIAFAICIKYCK